MGDYLKEGRIQQKRRTRTLLLRTASDLVARGATPTVTTIADAAGVSRRTAYRYFPTQDQLLAEAALEIARSRQPVSDLPDSIDERVQAAITSSQQFVYDNEAALRLLARLFLGRPLKGPKPRRTDNVPGRTHRVATVESALLPVRNQLSKQQYDRLVSAMTLCLGVEAALVLRYVRGLSPEEAIRVCCWSALQLVRGALNEKKRRS